MDESNNNNGVSIIPRAGERALIVGKTGSGKTAFACWLIPRLPDYPVVIYDTKIEPKFLQLPASHVVTTSQELATAWRLNSELQPDDPEFDRKKVDFFIFRPPVDDVINPEAMDNLLLIHYQQYHGTPAYIDEVYQFHKNSQAGPGLVSLLTRGRSKGITTIMSSQRPRRLSVFCLTESDSYYVFQLVDRNDRKRIAEVIQDYPVEERLERYYFRYYSHDLEAPILFRPVPLDKSMDTGYTDTSLQDLDPSPSLRWI